MVVMLILLVVVHGMCARPARSSTVFLAIGVVLGLVIAGLLVWALFLSK